MQTIFVFVFVFEHADDLSFVSLFFVSGFFVTYDAESSLYHTKKAMAAATTSNPEA